MAERRNRPSDDASQPQSPTVTPLS
jgi:hypothetical protein